MNPRQCVPGVGLAGPVVKFASPGEHLLRHHNSQAPANDRSFRSPYASSAFMQQVDGTSRTLHAPPAWQMLPASDPTLAASATTVDQVTGGGEQCDQLRNMHSRDAPDSVVPDFSMIMREDVSLRLDRSSGDFRMSDLKLFGDPMGCFADNFDLSLNGVAQHQVRLILGQRPLACEIGDDTLCGQHIPQIDNLRRVARC